MCGIAGFIGTNSRLDEGMLRRMLDAQKHRGPDDCGIMFQKLDVSQNGTPPLRVGMAHNRLSIQDLSGAGHQPMSDPSGTCWLCYNGEFYNSPGYREELKRRGISFLSTSDTEVLLHLCHECGVEQALNQVNGMFAFSFFDKDNLELYLCRDRAGQKPLHYLTLPDGSLVYASEINALLATGLVDMERWDHQALDHYWTMGFTTGERTFYQDIRRLRPGSFIHWKGGGIQTRVYWQVNFEPDDDHVSTMGRRVDELIGLLEDAVKLRLLSDVPVGICLSGGIDSALMALMISRLRADVPAYTIAFAGTPLDEARHAAAIARHLGLEHRILDVNGELTREFPIIASWYGEPFGDASSIPMYFLSRLIREHATVALTGDGGDEVFGGYHHYREGMEIWGQGYLENIGGVGGIKPWLRSLMLRGAGVATGYERMQRHVNERLKRRFYQPHMRHHIDPIETRGQRTRWLSASRDSLAAMQNCDFHVYMTDDVHAKVDRMSMAHALECRSPFMDFRVIEWAARLPTRYKLSKKGQGKLILREVLSRFMPLELYDRPKQGFTPPWEQWCIGPLRAKLRQEWREMNDPLMMPDAIDRLVPAEGAISPVLSWMAYSYVEWSKRVIHG